MKILYRMDRYECVADRGCPGFNLECVTPFREIRITSGSGGLTLVTLWHQAWSGKARELWAGAKSSMMSKLTLARKAIHIG